MLFYNPNKPIEILALPVAGPWANIKSATNYALEINPRICFPVHDGMLISFGGNHAIPKIVLENLILSLKILRKIKKEEL